MEAVILAGGLGTRLVALTAGRNKPMALVGGKPFLEYLLVQLTRNGIRDVVLCVGHRAAVCRDHFGDGRPWRLNLRYSVEQELRGTAGALKLAEPLLGPDAFLVLNGDSLFDVPFADLIRFHRHHNAVLSLALAQVEDARRFGTVVVDASGRVTEFAEKADRGSAGLINAGVYVMSRQVLDRVPPGRACSLEREILPSLVGQGLYGLPMAGYFVDIGVPEAFRQVQAEAARLSAAGKGAGAV